MRWWRPRTQPSPEPELNEYQQGSVQVPTRLDSTGKPIERVWADREAADHWDARVWRAHDLER